MPNHKRISNNPGFTHQHNLYFLRGRTDLGIEPGEGDKTGDPLFLDLSRNNFHLQKKSPAIDAGLNLGYTRDFQGTKVPLGRGPDIGAYEFTGKAKTD